jgi:tetratricopeptide (TPR) repeat protein
MGSKVDLGIVLIDIGNAYYSLGSFQEALQCADQSLLMAQEMGSLEWLWQARPTRREKCIRL